MPAEIADECGAERIHGGDSAIDVEIGLFSGGEGKTAGADRFFKQECLEVGCGLVHGVSMNIEQRTSNIEDRMKKILRSVACHGGRAA